MEKWLKPRRPPQAKLEKVTPGGMEGAPIAVSKQLLDRQLPKSMEKWLKPWRQLLAKLEKRIPGRMAGAPIAVSKQLLEQQLPISK